MIMFPPYVEILITVFGAIVFMAWIVTSVPFGNLLNTRELTKRFKEPIQWGVSLLPPLVLGIFMVINGTYQPINTDVPELILNHPPKISAIDNQTIRMAFDIFNLGNATAHQVAWSVYLIDKGFQSELLGVNKSVTNSLGAGQSFAIDGIFYVPSVFNGIQRVYKYQEYYICIIVKYSDGKSHSYNSTSGYEYNLNIPNNVVFCDSEAVRKILSNISDVK